MATRTVTSRGARAPLPSRLPDVVADHTELLIRSYLAGVRGNDLKGEDEWHRGRALIERMAASCRDRRYEPPSTRLTAVECADVLLFVRDVEPLDPRTWWPDNGDVSNEELGLYIVLQTLEDSLRAAPLEVRDNNTRRS